jgi:hypothetical protein
VVRPLSGQKVRMWFLLRTRLKTVLFTLVLGLAAPRIAKVLRGYGQKKRSAGGGTLTTTVPLTAADVLDKVAVWARPPKEQRRGRFSRR